MPASPVLETNWMASIVGLMIALGVICGISSNSEGAKKQNNKIWNYSLCQEEKQMRE
jgi:hypothetical protein